MWHLLSGMNVHVPSVRRPRSFYDVFGVVAIGVVVVAIVLTLWHGSFVRVEMVAFMAVLFLWATWAINEILEHAADDTRPRQNRHWK